MRSIFLTRPDPSDLRRRTAGWRQVWVWLPVVIACIVIATESTNTFSSDNTSGWIRPFVERFVGHINDQLWSYIHFVGRKLGHFTGFGTVSLTFLRAWLLTLGRNPRLTLRAWRWRSVLYAIPSTTLVASLDEWHQTFIPSRTGTVTDVLLDTCGAIIMCIFVALVCWTFRRSK